MKDHLAIKFDHKNKKYPNCWNCIHFSITWDPKFPYSCKLLGFKSKITPCIEVVRVDGIRCLGFEEKLNKRGLIIKRNIRRKRKVNLRA
jgi:hypothetical protein